MHKTGVPIVAQQVKNPASINEDAGSIPGSLSGLKDLALLWLWCRLAAAAPVQPLAWKPPYASIRQKTNKKIFFIDIYS